MGQSGWDQRGEETKGLPTPQPQAKWQCALEEMEVEEKVMSKAPLPYGAAEEQPGLEQIGGAEERPGLDQIAFWNWTRISESKKERECGGLGSGLVLILHPVSLFRVELFLLFRVDLTFLIAVACTVGILCTLWILYRAYRLLFMTYCTAMSRQGDAGESGRAGVEHRSIYVIESLRPPYRKGTTPPPPYDSPPPYHVAVVTAQLPEVLVSEPVVI